MKVIIKEFFSNLSKELIEFLTFMYFVLFGVAIKMIREKVQPTVKRVTIEILMSFFVALIVYSVLGQFFELNNFFLYATCSYAGSISSKFLNNVEKALDEIFKAIPEKFRNWGNPGNNIKNEKEENINEED